MRHPAELHGHESAACSIALRGRRDAEIEPHPEDGGCVDRSSIAERRRARRTEIHVLVPMRHTDGSSASSFSGAADSPVAYMAPMSFSPASASFLYRSDTGFVTSNSPRAAALKFSMLL